MAQALADKTVHVNAVEPGPVWTLPRVSFCSAELV